MPNRDIGGQRRIVPMSGLCFDDLPFVAHPDGARVGIAGRAVDSVGNLPGGTEHRCGSLSRLGWLTVVSQVRGVVLPEREEHPSG